MPQTFWERKSFWDKAELIFAVMTAAAGAVVASLAAFSSHPGLSYWRVGWASAAGTFACAVAASKWRVRILDERDKEAKRREQTAIEDRRQAEIRMLQERASSLTQRAIVQVLEGLRTEFFREGVNEADLPRATLFDCRAPDPEKGLGRRLCIYARAGVYGDSTRTWAIDDNEEAGCRGLAGQAWFTRTMISLSASCGWPTDGNPERKEEYALSLRLTLEEAESLNVKSRTLIATPIEVNGIRWGVLTLDCSKDVLISSSRGSIHRRLLRLSSAMISGILREADR